MYQIEDPLRSPLLLRRERDSLELRGDAVVAELMNVTDARQPDHHLLLLQLPEGVEVKVSKPLMPLPRTVRCAHGQAERPSELHPQQIEMVRGALDVDDEAVVDVVGSKDAVLDVDIAASLF
jgi:hypothetical protein